MLLRRAQKSIAKLRIGLAGPSGAGKTYSALLMASGLAPWDKIAVIDTENMSADLYSDLGEYNVYTLEPPYSPERFIEAIHECESAKMDVIIIDSVTHEWDGDGGCLQINERLANSKFKGNTWAAWSETTPRHQKFIDAITASKCHVITANRSKTETMQTDDKKIKKVGTKDIQRDGFEYELTVKFDLDRDKHYAIASKDRTGMFIDIDPFIIDKTTGEKLLAWANKGIDPTALAAEIAALMKIKGVSLQNTLAHYAVEDLTEVSYPKLLAMKNKLVGMPDKAETPPVKIHPPQDAPPAPPTAAEAVDVDEIDAGIAAKAENTPAPEARPVAPVEVNAAAIVDSAPDEVVMASVGDLKLLDALMQRRAKQAKKGYEALRDAFLKKLGIDTFGALTKDACRTLIDQFTAMVGEGKDDLVKNAEAVFHAEAR